MLLSSAVNAQDWKFEIEPLYKTSSSDLYNDTADKLLIRLVQNAKDSVQVYYRVYNSRTGVDFVQPANRWFSYQSFVWLVTNDIDSLNNNVFAEFDIIVTKQED